jgi:cytochrome c biogenesis protein
MTALPLSAASRRHFVRQCLEVLGSMRFSIALLTIICVASVIGTVLRQGEPLVNYVDAFGPFWTQVFGTLGLFHIYGATWFLVILAFLVASTSLCITRNAPKFWADFNSFKLHVRASSLKAFHHKAQGQSSLALSAAAQQAGQVLQQQGWQVKGENRSADAAGVNATAHATTHAASEGVMLAARKGRANKLGYIAAHLAIVFICIGGLLDGDLMSSLQARWMKLTPYVGGEEVTAHSLSERNPAFRAQLFVPEGQRSASAVINLEQGMLLQPLPFEVELRKFFVEYYDTGMPKRFASDVVIHDRIDGKQTAATIEVNHPFVYKGYTIFQSSFEDGGSQVELMPLPLHAHAGQAAQAMSLVVGDAGVDLPKALTPNGGLRLELTALRPINVENRNPSEGDVDLSQASAWAQHLGSGSKGDQAKQLHNVGPLVSYKLRDPAGQAKEFQNYMLPSLVEGEQVFLLGVRELPSEPFRYLRVPADENMQMAGWLRLQNALLDPSLRSLAAKQVAQLRMPASQPALRDQLQVSAEQILTLFAGQGGTQSAGFDALTEFVGKAVPAAEQARVSETLLRLLNTSLLELNQIARQRSGLPSLPIDDPDTARFMTRAVLALSDAQYYPAPVVFMPISFEQRQASVFQVTRTPGRVIVYAGCIMLIVGVFAMLYIRERRVWVWLEAGDNNTAWSMALSTPRQTLDIEREFAQLSTHLGAALAADPSHAKQMSSL